MDFDLYYRPQVVRFEEACRKLLALVKEGRELTPEEEEALELYLSKINALISGEADNSHRPAA